MSNVIQFPGSKSGEPAVNEADVRREARKYLAAAIKILSKDPNDGELALVDNLTSSVRTLVRCLRAAKASRQMVIAVQDLERECRAAIQQAETMQ